MPSVIPAGPDRVEDLAALLGRAFAGDEMIRWKLRPGVTADDIGETYVEVVRTHAELGTLWETDGGAGVAGWLPPDRIDAFERLVVPRARPATLRFADDGGIRYDAFWNWLGARAVVEGAWYLDFVAVDPPTQGRGHGAALVRHGLARAAAAGQPATLATETLANVRPYEHLGFRVVDEGDAPLNGPHMWFLRADPT